LENHIHQYFVHYCREIDNLEINYLGVVGEKTLHKFHKMYSRYYLNSLLEKTIKDKGVEERAIAIKSQVEETVSAFQYGWYENDLVKSKDNPESRVQSIYNKARYK